MAISVSSPEDCINIALIRLGSKLRVGSIWEGTLAAKKSLDLYAQTRDALLMDGEWGFAQGDVAGNLLKAAPAGGYNGNEWSNTYPPLPWLYEYSYPSDCLKVRAVKPTPIFVPNFMPRPYLFAVVDDNSYTPPVKTICCNIASAVVVYTRQVTNPQAWEADFVELLVAGLARRLAPVLASPDFVKLEAADEQASEQMTEGEHG